MAIGLWLLDHEPNLTFLPSLSWHLLQTLGGYNKVDVEVGLQERTNTCMRYGVYGAYPEGTNALEPTQRPFLARITVSFMPLYRFR